MPHSTVIMKELQRMPTFLEKTFLMIRIRSNLFLLSQDIDDSLTYDLDSIDVEDITEQMEYHGLRLSIVGYLDKTRIPIGIDIGFGDIVFPDVVKMDYPVIDIEGTGTHIRDLIRESGHTVSEVSDYLGTSTSLVYRYIRGEVLPSIDRIVALSVYLEVPIERIIAVE